MLGVERWIFSLSSTMISIVDDIWLIPAVPLAASLIIISVSNSRRRSAAGLAVLGQIIALILAVAAFVQTLSAPGYRVFHNFTWFTFGENTLRLGWVIDPLAV